MKVTVYRRNEPDGYGAPVACIGDETPKGENWFENAKADVIEEGEPGRLLLLGRAFLIYSMYHAREPLYLAYAIENFGAACRKLGYGLPLPEADATWRSYNHEELDAGAPADYRCLFDQIARVFGAKAARAQAEMLGMSGFIASLKSLEGQPNGCAEEDKNSP